MKTKYIVWIRENGKWEEQGDGPLTEKTAHRVANEIRASFRLSCRILPVGINPVDLAH